MAKKKKNSILVTNTFTFTTIHLKHNLFTHICTNVNRTHTTVFTYATHHQKVAKSSATTWRISTISCRHVLVLIGLRFTSAATWRISCNTYADALNYIEFCILRFFSAILSAILEFVSRFMSNFYS